MKLNPKMRVCSLGHHLKKMFRLSRRPVIERHRPFPLRVLRIGILLAVFFALLAGVTLAALRGIDYRIRRRTVNNLTSVLNATRTEVWDVWANVLLNEATAWAADPYLIDLTQQLVRSRQEQGFAVASPAMQEIRTLFETWLGLRHALGIFLISTDGTNLASMHDDTLSRPNLLLKTQADRLDHVFSGSPQISLPLPSDIPLLDSQGDLVEFYPTMFVLVPVKAANSVLAALAVRVDAVNDFSRIVESGKLGDTGQTYAFDRNGLLLSNSRFEELASSTGYLAQNQLSMLNLHVRIPVLTDSSFVEWGPLTTMAARAIRGEDGHSLEPYLNYLGIPVLGTWLWDSDLEMGFATEINFAEALGAFVQVRRLVLGLVSLVVLLGGVFFYLLLKTERRMTKKTARTAAYLRTIFDSALDAIIIINERGQIQDINTSTTRIFGYTRDELIGKDVGTLAAEPNSSAHPSYISRYLQTGEARVVGTSREVTARHKGGTEFPLRLSVSEVQIEGSLVFIGIMQDIRAQKKLQVEREQLAVFPETNPNIVARILRDGSMAYMNPYFLTLLQQSKIDQPEEAFPERFVDLVDQVLDTGEIIRDQQHECFDRIFSCQFTPSPDRESVYVFGQDITELVRGQRELRLATEEAERANRAKSDFLANMSHELRTPLNAIIGFSDVLYEQFFGELNEKQSEYVADIASSGRHLLALINDILDLAKIEAGKMELDRALVHVPNLLRESLILIREKCFEHGITLSLEIDPSAEELMLWADERKIKQILYNLLSNAAKFTPDEGRITLAAKQCDQPAPCLEFSVSDSGIGIKASHLSSIFEDFYQVDATTSKYVQGTGLGLSLVRQFVDLHEGRVWAESDGEELGTRFVVQIPIQTSFEREEEVSKRRNDERIDR